MKKVFLLALSLMLLLGFAACSQPSLNEEDILAAAQEIIDKQNAEQKDDIFIDDDIDDNIQAHEENEDSASGIVEKDSQVSTDELNKNITVAVFPLANGEALFQLTNNNSTDIALLSFSITFYDDNQKIIKNYETYFTAMGAGRDVYATSYDFYESEIDFDNYKVKIDADNYDLGYNNAIDDLNVQANVSDDGNVMAEITNNGSKPITSLNAMILYYADDKVIGASYDSGYDLKAGDFDVLEFWPPVDKKYRQIDYDTYTVFINEAYTG